MPCVELLESWGVWWKLVLVRGGGCLDWGKGGKTVYTESGGER